jgi:hypothetical protein
LLYLLQSDIYPPGTWPKPIHPAIAAVSLKGLLSPRS